MATTGNYYIDTIDFNTATAVFTNEELTTKAADGFYKFGDVYREQANGNLLPLKDCPSCSVPFPFMITSGFSLGTEACASPNYMITVYTSSNRFDNSDVAYTDAALSNVFDGDDKYYKVNIETPASIRIDGSGVITEKTQCI